MLVVGFALFLSYSSSSTTLTRSVSSSWQIQVSDTTKKDSLKPSLRLQFDSKAARRRADSLGISFDSLAFVNDSIRALQDTVAEKIDSTWVVYLDSTVRMDQFVYQRTDVPVVELFPHKRYSLFLRNQSPAYQREINLDSAGQFVTARERVNGLDVKVPLTVPLDEYIRQRYEEEKYNNWRTFTREYTIQRNQDELSGILSNITNIDIPIPANPILSIFGKPIINLHPTGQIDIRAAFRSVKSDQVSLNQLDVSRNEPDFNQQVQINVSGTVGDKLNILADWNTQRTFEYENSLKIKYTGYEDEIVQSVEAGNVSLSTPGLIGGGQALFGIKARLQTGPLMLTTLVSQKKGQTKELTASGGQQGLPQDIFPQGYSNSYYFIDTVYRKFWAPLHLSASPTIDQEMLENQVVQIDVWASVQLTTANSQNIKKGRAYVNLPYHDLNGKYNDSVEVNLHTDAGGKYEGNFIKLDAGKDYRFRFDGGRQVYGGYLILNTSIPDDQALAVSYTVLGSGGSPRQYGPASISSDTTLDGRILLKLLKPPYLSRNPGYKPAWDLQLRNIYALGGRDLKPDGFTFQLIRRTEGADQDQINGAKLLEVVGLDRFNVDNQPPADTRFDFIPGLTVDIERAEVIFPSLRPFDSGIADYFKGIGKPVGDSLLFSDVYDTTFLASQNNVVKNRYVMKVVSSTGVSSTYNLGFNVVEGSVHVILDGQELQPNVDYTVDYIVGQVNIKKPEASLPGHNVQVKYEQNDLFQLASKTLIGARGELNLFPNTRLGFTAMNLNQATLSDKVRLGEEPTNNMMLGVDGSTSMNIPFLTDLIDALPFIRTREMSTIRFGGEAAYSLPDPNTKKSPLPSDNGVSVAYLDDFEGARQTIPIDVNYAAWRPGSPPVYDLLNRSISDTNTTSKSFHRSRMWWYNNFQGFENVSVNDIWPYRSVRVGQNFVYPLYLEYDPSHKGMYNYSPKLDSTLNRGVPTERAKDWNGVMRYIGTYAGSVLDRNIAYLEVWAQVFDRNTANGRPVDLDNVRKGKLFIDLGRISEDVIPNRQLNSEDIIRTTTNPQGVPRGVVNDENDRGLDMIFDQDERQAYQDFISSNRDSLGRLDADIDPNDPSGDDYNYDFGKVDFSKINGAEANIRLRREPDTEDLNRNGSVDFENEYVEYEIPLDTVYFDSNAVLRDNPLIVGGNRQTGWYQFRIPLLAATRVVGSQGAQGTLSNVQYIRMWLSGFERPVIVRVAEIDLVGNQWQQYPAKDSIMKLSVVNLEDNPEYNTPDYRSLGIVRERDKTQPDQNILGNEQSLSLVLNGLPVDSSREAYKTYPVRPLDIFNYKSMKMFVHGDPAFTYIDPGNYDAQIYVRFGADTVNFYEYSLPVRPGWAPLNEINISFAELTAIKASRDSVNKLFTIPVTNGPPGASYGVKGNPSLRSIRYIGIGVRNPSLPNKTNMTPLRGQIWVNELRLVDVDNSAGFAYHFDTQIKLADLGAFSFNYSKINPNFHGLDQRFGDQNDKTNWAMNASMELARFFPESWQGTQISTSYSHSESMVKPKYLPNTDVVVAEAAVRADDRRAAQPTSTTTGDKIITESQTLHVQDSYALTSLKIVPPIRAWYVRETLSKLSFGFNYNRSMDRAPATESRTAWSWTGSANYGVSFPADLYFQPFQNLFSSIPILKDYKDWKIFFFPFTNFSARIGAQRSRTYEISRLPNSTPRETRGFGVTKGLGFGWKLTEGGLTGLGGDYGLTMDRSLINLDNDSVGRNFSSILKTLLFGGTDSRYGQRVTVNMKPRIPNVFDITKYLDLSSGYGVNYSWQNTFQRGDLGKSAGWDNNIQLGMTLRLKSMFDPLFPDTPDAPRPANEADLDTSKSGIGGRDSTSAKGPRTNETKAKSQDVLKMLKTAAKVLIKIPFLDYENISISFTQQNRAGSSGIVGSTGFLNFWGRAPWQGSLLENGPSRLYQLGVISDPSGRLRYSPSSSFPFLGWRTERGLRAPSAQLQDQFSQANNLTFRTNRPLWEGASLEVNWKVGWQFSKSTSFATDSLGAPDLTRPSSVTTAGNIERSFLSVPPIFFLKVFRSNLEDVGKKYEKLIIEGASPAAAAAESFEKGMEALPFLNKIFGQYVPRPNWSLRWDGLEKIGGLKSVVDRLSLEHAYSSSFRRDFRGAIDGSEQTDNERISYGFSPLLSLNATFKELFKGSLSGNFRMNSTSSYDLSVSTQQITETFTQEMTLSLTYSRRGFKLPLFGLNLNNDVDFSLTFSRAKNSRKTYDPKYLTQNQEGSPLDGNTRTSLEPRMKYTISSRVSASLFYRFSRIAPDEGGSTIFGTTTNEAGVDIHISIQ